MNYINILNGKIKLKYKIIDSFNIFVLMQHLN